MNFRIGPVLILLGVFIALISAASHQFLLGEISLWHEILFMIPVICSGAILYFFIKRSLKTFDDNLQKNKKKFVFSDFNEKTESLVNLSKDLNKRDKFISDILKTSINLVIAWQKDGDIISFNDTALETYGFLEKGHPYRTIYDFLNEHADYVAQKVIDDAAQGKSTFGYETILQHNTGRQIIIWDVVPHLNQAGEIDYIIACGVDTTKQRNAERKNRLSAQLFEATIEAVMITDDKGDIVDVNPAFEEITGYMRNEVIGRNPRFMKSDRHENIFYTQMWDDLIQRGFWRGEVWDVRKNGEEFPKQLSITASKNAMGRITNYIAVFSDISEKIKDQEKLQSLAHFDALTDLPNRVLFTDRLNSALARSRRDQDLMCLMFIDLDRFKQVNDTLGHRIGDELLKEVSNRLKHSVREIDTVSRLSGDEFTVILTDILSTDDIDMVASRIVKSVGAPYFIEGHELFISASLGIAVFPSDGDSSQDLLKNADIAMYHAKSKGRNNYQYFMPTMNEKVQNELSLANQLRVGLNRSEVKPHYQLKVDCITGFPVGMEALARWSNDRGHFIAPDRFIPIAEENGLIVKLGSSIMHQVCQQMRMWQDMNFEFGRVSINLSAKQFRDTALIDTVREVIEDHKISAEKLEFEVTENIMMDDIEGARRVLNQLKNMGVSISIDDFGTGYSSLNYLKKFPVDILKIDRAFIKDLKPGSDDSAIVSAIVLMCDKLGIEVVAEGVETKEQINFISSVGCRVVQGYYYSKPCSGGEVPLIWNKITEDFSQKHALLS